MVDTINVQLSFTSREITPEITDILNDISDAEKLRVKETSENEVLMVQTQQQ